MARRDGWSVDPTAEAGPWFVGAGVAVVLVALAVWPTSQPSNVAAAKGEQAALTAPVPVPTAVADPPTSLTPFTIPPSEPASGALGESAADGGNGSSIGAQAGTGRTVSRSAPPAGTQAKATTTIPPSRPPSAVTTPPQVKVAPTTTTTSTTPPSTTTSTRRRGLLG